MADKKHTTNPNILGPTTRNYYRRNYDDALELITPNTYLDEDLSLSSTRINIFADLTNRHITIAKEFGGALSGFSPSALPGSTYFSALNFSSFSGIARYFDKTNRATEITPFDFEQNILRKMGKKFSDFETSAEFQHYVSGTLLPKTVLNYPATSAESGLQLSGNINNIPAALDLGNPASGAHEHLIKHLSWFYFLNTSALTTTDYQPSAYVTSAFVDKLYRGKSLYINDAMKGLTEFLWRNYTTSSSSFAGELAGNSFADLGLLPPAYVSSVDCSTTDTSGHQQLEKLKTLIDILYAPDEFSFQDTLVKDAFNSYVSTSATLTTEESAGPFRSLLKALGFSFADFAAEADKLSLLYDIDDCPADYLQSIADIIGWNFFGHDTSRQRLQLTNAVDVYKRTGTKQAIQLAVDSTFASGVHDISSNITEMWESYVPHLLMYALATESPLFESLNSWTPAIAESIGVQGYNSSSIEGNLRLAVDYIILTLVEKFPDKFPLGKQSLTEFIEEKELVFNYRERLYPIPPFEEYLYYKHASISEPMLEEINNILTCSFAVGETFSTQVTNYIKENTITKADTLNNIGNGWFMLTTAAKYPPNEKDILQILGNEANTKKFELRDKYISLWSGKSSTIKITFQSTGFAWDKVNLDPDSPQVLYQVARVAEQFLPAHTLADILLEISDSEYFLDKEGHYAHDLSASKMIIGFKKSDYFDGSADSYASGGALARASFSGVDMSAGNRTFRRDEVDGTNFCNRSASGGGLQDTLITNDQLAWSSNIASPPGRSAWRRRDLGNLFETNGYYDRTGFNMPIGFEASTLEYSLSSQQSEGTKAPYSLGFLPLGYIPSAGKFETVYDDRCIDNLNLVYRSCETLDSQNTFSGVDVSNTFPCRGLSSITASEVFSALGQVTRIGGAANSYVDRSDLSDSVALMHRINERMKLSEAEAYISSLKVVGSVNYNALITSANWWDAAKSTANYLTNGDKRFHTNAVYADSDPKWDSVFKNVESSAPYFVMGATLESNLRTRSWTGFTWGKRLHKLYKVYTNDLHRHSIAPSAVTADGRHIISHTYGPLLHNATFDKDGSAVAFVPLVPLIASSFAASDTSTLTLRNVFSGEPLAYLGSEGTFDASVYGSRVTNSISDLTLSAGAGGASSYEFRNPHILSGVDLVMTSGLAPNVGDVQNSFTVYGISSVNSSSVKDETFLHNRVIKCKAHQGKGFPRIVFNLKKFSEIDKPNLLIPEHDFVAKVRFAAGEETGNKQGEAKVGMFIHTVPEGKDNKLWIFKPGRPEGEAQGKHWNESGEWILLDASAVTKNDVIEKYSHIGTATYSPSDITCIDQFSTDVSGDKEFNAASINKTTEESFFELEVPFNTRNNRITVPHSYYSSKKHYSFIPEASAVDLRSWDLSAAVTLSGTEHPPQLLGPNNARFSDTSGCAGVGDVFKVQDEAILLKNANIGCNGIPIPTNTEYYTGSIFLRPGEVSAVTDGAHLSLLQLAIGDNITNALINWEGGVNTPQVTTTGNVGPGEHLFKFEKVAAPATDSSLGTADVSGWYRVAVSLLNQHGGSKISMNLWPAYSIAPDTNNNKGSVLAWGPKLEVGKVDASGDGSRGSGFFPAVHHDINDIDSLPTEYPAQDAQMVHRKDQKYVIEVFQLPTFNKGQFTVIDTVSIQDLTLYDWATVRNNTPWTPLDLLNSHAMEDNYCDQVQTKLWKPELLDLLRHFNSLQEGKSSRNAVVTSAIYELSGGTRLNYREHPNWGASGITASSVGMTHTKYNNYTLIEVEN